jgi:glycerol-3-phosphate acyltransferase PlsY
MKLVLFVLGAFLCGSIPFGLLIGLAKGTDIRRVGSGNIGATNVGRVFGKPWFFACFALDFLKGLVPTLAAGVMLGTLGRFDAPAAQAWGWLAVLAAAVLGHVFCPWLGFKGGKGVATSLGALVAIYPALTVPGLAALGVFLLVLGVWRYVSLGAIAAGLSTPLWVAAWFHAAHAGWLWVEKGRVTVAHMAPYLTLALALAAMVVWTHRANIKRLRAGTEPRAGQRLAAKPG